MKERKVISEEEFLIQINKKINETHSDKIFISNEDFDEVLGRPIVTLESSKKKLFIHFKLIKFQSLGFEDTKRRCRIIFNNCDFGTLNFFEISDFDISIGQCKILSLDFDFIFNTALRIHTDCRIDEMRIIPLMDQENELSCRINGSSITDCFVSNVPRSAKMYFIKNSISSLIFQNSINGEILVSRIENLKLLKFVSFLPEDIGNNHLKINKISLDDDGEILARNSNFNSYVEISNCNFLKATWDLVDSDISSIKYFNVLWPQKVSSAYGTSYYLQKECFRQLKVAADSIKDTVQFKNFGSLELESYYKYLKKEDSNSSNIIPLWVSWITNRFGRSWLRPIVLILVTTAIFHIMLSTITGCDFQENLFSVNYFEMLLPTHSFEKVVAPACKTTIYGQVVTFDYLYGFAFVLDMFQRIIAGFLIFQLIRAFRFYYVR